AKVSRGWLHGPGTAGLIKVVEDADRGVLVGATSVGPWGGEVLSMLTLAVHAEVPVAKLRTMHYAFPTFHRRVLEAVRAVGPSARGEASADGVVGLAGQRLAPRIGARDAELGEGLLGVLVHPRLTEGARDRHAVLRLEVVRRVGVLLVVEEHPLRHGESCSRPGCAGQPEEREARIFRSKTLQPSDPRRIPPTT